MVKKSGKSVYEVPVRIGFDTDSPQPLIGVAAVLIAELGIDCLAPLVKGITDVSSQLEGFVYTNLQLFPMVITPFLIVWGVLSDD
jgi:hypothetical protein